MITMAYLETETKRLEFVKNLKVGDTVAVDSGSFGVNYKYKLRRVLRITPTGKIVLEDESKKFDSSGYIPGNKYDSSKHICDPAAVAEPMLRERAINALEMAKFKDFPTEKLEKLYNVLKE